ncbi:Cytokinesis protein sepH [Talaromyces atroroseus]|uniref:Cytokinesis protein sepH n=1 Tax=Talaromyces atroroseus TaxID=1441469 RepID=A0A225AL04_TALAT|nr:Cytokinesis protein sepH [Talaromyces atroroseus]OKL58984.1 Cytokinesis protein sepH [Talaromyces atroroseus]
MLEIDLLKALDGLVKLADFGVASRTTGLHESSVVGTPYWMAPEVIELSGATTSSDIWSLGCTVIELLDGKPPYHKLQPMPALFRIVNDDHPPLPQGASPAVKDFLMQCFQKDPNLRVSARKLLKHPWIVNAHRSESVVPKKPTEYEEAVKSVQEWNEALRSPDSTTVRRSVRTDHHNSGLPRLDPLNTGLRTKDLTSPSINRNAPDKFRSPDPEDNWDDDFDSAISPRALDLPHLRPHDHLGGLLSSERLKAFASLDGTTMRDTLGSFSDNETTLGSSTEPMDSDPLETIRPLPRRVADENKPNLLRPRSRHRSGNGVAAVSGVQVLGNKPVLSPSKPLRQTRPAAFYSESAEEDFSDLIVANDDVLERKLGLFSEVDDNTPRTSLLVSSQQDEYTGDINSDNSEQTLPIRSRARGSIKRSRSSIEIQKFAEDEHDEDFSDIFGNEESTLAKPASEHGSDRSTLMLQSKLSNNSWLGDQDDEDDPFAQLEEGFDEMDLETNIARDKYARLRNQIEGLVSSLKTSQDDDVLADISEQLLDIFCDLPETKAIIIGSHGMLPMLEILEGCRRRDIISNLLKIINSIIYNDYEIQENLCFVGGIPIINEFASKKYPREIRLEAATFVQQMYQSSTLNLQMFVSAGGLNVLVDFLEDDYEDERDLVLIGVNGIWSVFELQGSTPKNDFCRILSRNSVLDPLSLVLSRVLDEDEELAKISEGRIANIFFIFSQAENHVKEMVAERTVLHRVLKELRRMTPTHQITMLKFIKNLSMLSTTLESLQNSNAIDVLTELLRSTMKQPHFREVSNQILNTIYNMCRLSKPRQEDAALNGIIPLLQKIVKTERPLKEFALPILCDMAHSGRVGRRELWRNKGLPFYISLLSDPYWQVTALDAIFAWLQEETAKVEEHLLEDRADGLSFTDSIVKCLTISKANAFENLLEPLQKLLRLSPPVASTLARADLFTRIRQKLHHNKAAVRLNLLRILSSICDSTEEQGDLLARCGLLDAIGELENDPAVLVRDMAGKLLKSSELLDSLAGAKRRPLLRRTSTSALSQASGANLSRPTTPNLRPGQPSRGLFDVPESPRHQRKSLRPVTRDGSASAVGLGDSVGHAAARSRVPRAMNSRLSLVSSLQSDDTRSPSSLNRPPSAINARRRRQTNNDIEWS